jgi:hypothetical protein
MKTAWTRMLGLGMLSCALACVVTVDGDDDDGFGGRAGSAGRGGSNNSGGSSASAGTSPFAGSGGSMDSGVDFPAPTCDPEDGDELDECVQCFKRNCCSEWLGCDDQNCTLEWISVAECLEEQEVPGEDELGMCISEASEAADGFVQSNTQALIDCALEPVDDAGFGTRCSVECFGSDIILE